MIPLPRINCNNQSLTVTIALWTIIQTFLHVYALLYIQWWRDCRLHGTQNYFQFLFGDVVCDFNSTAIANDVHYSGVMESWVTHKVDVLVLTYFTFNSLWLISSVGLLTGACCIIREVWALVFYLPWVVINIIMLFYDVFCTIYFGVHVPSNGTFWDWFSFLGLTSKINDVQYLENGSLDMIVGALSILMTFIAARAIIIWIVNLIFLIVIVKITRTEYNSKYNHQNRYRTSQNIENPEPSVVSRPEKTPIVRTNSQRVRDWHRFYDTTKISEKKRVEIDEEKYYDCIEDNNLCEASNLAVKDVVNKDELLLSVHTYHEGVPSTSGRARKLSNVNLSFGAESDQPSTSSANVIPKSRPIRIVTHGVDKNDSEIDENFRLSSGRDFQKAQNISK